MNTTGSAMKSAIFGLVLGLVTSGLAVYAVVYAGSKPEEPERKTVAARPEKPAPKRATRVESKTTRPRPTRTTPTSPKPTPTPAALTPTVEKTDAPKVFCPEPVYDFGTMENTKKVKHDFVIRNVGGETLRITKVRTSCGCTVAQPKKRCSNRAKRRRFPPRSL